MSHPSWLLALGVFVLFMAAAYTRMGEVWFRTRWIRRANGPKQYWLVNAMFYLIGVVLIAVFFSQVHPGR